MNKMAQIVYFQYSLCAFERVVVLSPRYLIPSPHYSKGVNSNELYQLRDPCQEKEHNNSSKLVSPKPNQKTELEKKVVPKWQNRAQ